MTTPLGERSKRLSSTAPFWSLRYHEEKHESHAMRQDTLEPPRMSIDRGAMLTAVTQGGDGDCATRGLFEAGLQKALGPANGRALATERTSVGGVRPGEND